MKRFIILAGLIILLFLVLIWFRGTTLSLAEIPRLINYQGMLTNDSGDPITDTLDLQFRIYNSETYGDLKWSETQNQVPIIDGLFNVILGSENLIDTLSFFEQYWLEVQVDDDTVPRIRFTSVGYAYRAKIADSAVVAVSAPTGGGWTDGGTVVRLETGSDSVGIGTSNPLAKLDVQGTVNVGENGTGYDVNFYGADYTSRMFWDESKMALRAGQAGSEWDDANVGEYSFATGLYTQAKGNYSVATGNATDANGNYSMAVGQLATASGTFSTVIGQSSSAAGSFSTAIGRWVTADSNYTFVLGAGLGNTHRLVNDVPSSFMVGFDDTIPTLFVDGSSVGIGTTNPQEKLHVWWDTNVDAELGRGVSDTDITYLALRNANGTKCYIYPNATGDAIVVSTIKP